MMCILPSFVRLLMSIVQGPWLDLVSEIASVILGVAVVVTS